MFRAAILILLCTFVAHGQVITTVAGSGILFTDNGKPAAAAHFELPSGVNVAPDGSVLISAPTLNMVFRVTQDGNIHVLAGNGIAGFSGDGGPASLASLNSPQGITSDRTGNVFIADYQNGRIRKVATDGTISTVVSGMTPNGITASASGSIYFIDYFAQVVRRLDQNGTISIVAGNGVNGFSGDGGPATSASLSFPADVALDSAGNLYIADMFNYRLRKVDTQGIITTIAGNGQFGSTGDGGPPTSAAIAQIGGVVVDPNGNVYISDINYGRVRRIGPGSSGNVVITTVAGAYPWGFSGDGGPAVKAIFDGIRGIALDSLGRLYIADQQNDRVRVVSPGGIVNTFAGAGRFTGDGGPAIQAHISSPAGVAVDAAGNIYITDGLGFVVRKVNPAGIISTVAGNGIYSQAPPTGSATLDPLDNLTGIAADPFGSFYFFDGIYGEPGPLYRVSSSGIVSATGIQNAAVVATDQNGNVFTAGNDGYVRELTTSGAVNVIAGNGGTTASGDGGTALSAAFGPAAGIGVDATGNVYVADNGNGSVRKVSSGGLVTSVARVGQMSGLIADPAGNVYVSVGNRVVKVSALGTVTNFAGNGTAGFSGDGGLATKAALNNPKQLALDSAGNLYFADAANGRVREVLGAPPAYTASPATITLSSTAGGRPVAATISLATTASGLGFAAATSAAWLSANPSVGSMPSAVQVSADPSGLAAGAYQATVTISASNATPSSTVINVSFTVAAATPPKLATSAPTIAFSAAQGGAAVTQTLQVLNTGGGAVPFTATVTSGGGAWLTLSAQSGSATPSSPISLAVTATPGSMPAGTYSGAIAITGGGVTITVPTTLSISAPSGTLLLSQNALTFNAVAQGGSPLPQVFSILNTGQGSLSWNASSNTLAGGNWLQISPSTGSVQRPFLDYSTVTATVNPSGLAAGTYYGSIQISSSGAVNSPQSVTVILNVLPPGTSLGPQIYPNGLIFTGPAGTNPGSQTITVGNTAGAPNSYVSGIIGPVQFLPTSATIQPSQPQNLVVQPDFTNLSPGITRGTITLQFSDGSAAQAIGILMSAAPPSASGTAAYSKLEPHASSCPPAALNVVFRLPQPSFAFVATVGQSLTLEASVSDSCGNLIVPGSQQPRVVVFLSNGDPQQTMSYIGNGIWQASWRPVNSGQNVVATVDAVILSGSTVVGGQATVHGIVIQPQSGRATPLVTAQGVVHAASDAGGAPIAPGELISVYGSNLASGAGNASSGLPLPLSANGAQVLLGGQPLPILYTSSGQMNVQVPYTVATNTTIQLSVQNGNALSVPQSLTVAQASPGIFTSNEQGFGQGAIVKSDGVTLAQPGTPASVGEAIVIYCTGLGATSPGATAGQPAPSTPPLAQTTNPVSVNIGGIAAQVLFSGLTPGFAGLYQVNAIVPAGVTQSDTVPVTIAVAGQTSQSGVTMSVH